MLFSTKNMPSYETLLQTAGALATSAVVLKTVTRELIPDAFSDNFVSRLQKIYRSRLTSQATIVIEESDGLIVNQMFHSANVYLGNKLSSSTQRIKVQKQEKEKVLDVSVDRNQELVDVFKGVKMSWVLVSSQVPRSAPVKKNNSNALPKQETRYFELSFHKKHREMVLSSYLPYILQQAKEIREEKRTLKLHTVDYNGTDYWGSVNLIIQLLLIQWQWIQR